MRLNPPPLGGEPGKAPRKHTPFPSIIDGHLWTVKEGNYPAMIDRRLLETEGGIMQVPLDDSLAARKLRLHEQAHVAWTPNVDLNNVPDVDPKSLNATEDARVIHLMNRRNGDWRKVNAGELMLSAQQVRDYEAAFSRLGVRMRGGEEVPGEKVMPLVQAARLVAAAQGYYESRLFEGWTASNGLDFVNEVVHDMHYRHIGGKENPTFEDATAYAQELQQHFDNLEQLIRDAKDALDEADMPEQFKHKMKELPADQLEDKPGWDNDQWGEMEIQNVPLPLKLRGDPSRKTRATDMGAVPRYLHRLPVDQRVFGRRRKHRRFQGTLLIDLSGSMSLSPEQVEEILQRWPAVTIGTYSGYGNGKGVLRIIAKKGRRCDHEYLGCPAGGTNEVDGPALDWLGKQRGPRVWISDGYVSGAGENFQPWFWLDAARKVNRHKIKRIEDVQDLLDA